MSLGVVQSCEKRNDKLLSGSQKSFSFIYFLRWLLGHCQLRDSFVPIFTYGLFKFRIVQTETSDFVDQSLEASDVGVDPQWLWNFYGVSLKALVLLFVFCFWPILLTFREPIEGLHIHTISMKSTNSFFCELKTIPQMCGGIKVTITHTRQLTIFYPPKHLHEELIKKRNTAIILTPKKGSLESSKMTT